MISTIISEKQTAVFAHIQKALEDIGLEVRLFHAGEVKELFGAPLLVVSLPKDALGRDRVLNFAFMLENEVDSFDFLSLIQIYIPFPIKVEADQKLKIEALVLQLNNQVPMGNFGITEGDQLYFRYMMSTEKWALLPNETLQQMVLFFAQIMNTFTPLFDKQE